MLRQKETKEASKLQCVHVLSVQGGIFAVSWSLDHVLEHLALQMLTVQGGL